MNLEALKIKALSNPVVKAEYDALSEEFELIDCLITMRKKSGLTQEEIAQKMGTQRSNVSRLEKGKSNPNWKTICDYAHACGFKAKLKFAYSAMAQK